VTPLGRHSILAEHQGHSLEASPRRTGRGGSCWRSRAISSQLAYVRPARSTVGTERGEPERYRARRKVLRTRAAGIRRPTPKHLRLYVADIRFREKLDTRVKAARPRFRLSGQWVELEETLRRRVVGRATRTERRSTVSRAQQASGGPSNVFT
jgi:hypothetical protein